MDFRLLLPHRPEGNGAERADQPVILDDIVGHRAMRHGEPGPRFDGGKRNGVGRREMGGAAARQAFTLIAQPRLAIGRNAGAVEQRREPAGA